MKAAENKRCVRSIGTGASGDRGPVPVASQEGAGLRKEPGDSASLGGPVHIIGNGAHDLADVVPGEPQDLGGFRVHGVQQPVEASTYAAHQGYGIGHVDDEGELVSSRRCGIVVIPYGRGDMGRYVPLLAGIGCELRMVEAEDVLLGAQESPGSLVHEGLEGVLALEDVRVENDLAGIVDQAR